MPTNNFEEFDKWAKEHGDESLKSTRMLLDILHTMAEGDELEVILNKSKHLIKRTSGHTWKFICDCCFGKCLAMGGGDVSVPVTVNESTNKKWYEVK